MEVTCSQYRDLNWKQKLNAKLYTPIPLVLSYCVRSMVENREISGKGIQHYKNMVIRDGEFCGILFKVEEPGHWKFVDIKNRTVVFFKDGSLFEVIGWVTEYLRK